jgi:glycosyltransferase involved in cell wall biosynthesis
MRVLVVSQHFWPEGFYINNVVASLSERGYMVDVLTGKPNYPEGHIFPGYGAWSCEQETWEGASIFRVPLFPRGHKSGWRLFLNYLSFILSGSVFGQWQLRGRQYDVIFVYGVSPILQAILAVFFRRRTGGKVILWVQDLWPDSLAATGYVRDQRILRIIEFIVRWLYRRVDLLLVQSQAFIPTVSRQAGHTSVAHHPNSVDTIFAATAATPVALPDIPAIDEGFAVVFAGNIGNGQAVEVIIKAAAYLVDYPGIRFVIIGQGSSRDWMKQQIQTRGLSNIHLPGGFPIEVMPGLLKKAGALLVTLADEPIFALTIPNKIQAYLAVGRPIIACLNGEGGRVVDEARAGLHVPAEDAERLAAAILELYSMPEGQRQAMGAAGRCYFLEHFDHEMLVDRLIDHFKDLVGRGVAPI